MLDIFGKKKGEIIQYIDGEIDYYNKLMDSNFVYLKRLKECESSDRDIPKEKEMIFIHNHSICDILEELKHIKRHIELIYDI